jgi:flavin reductase (DIM6/NTAB) family NADH-FMN oxidoreductase RutF
MNVEVIAMAKVSLKPAVALFPVPVILATTADGAGKINVITLAWAGTVCSQPPMVSISVRPSRYSYELLKANGEFVVHVPTEHLMWAADRCGTLSGRDLNKFDAAGLTAIAAEKVKAPLIAECPVAMECVVRHVIPLGSHDLFLGEVVALHANEEVLDKSGRIDPGLLWPLTYLQPEYWGVRERIGLHGYSRKE